MTEIIGKTFGLSFVQRRQLRAPLIENLDPGNKIVIFRVLDLVFDVIAVAVFDIKLVIPDPFKKRDIPPERTEIIEPGVSQKRIPLEPSKNIEVAFIIRPDRLDGRGFLKERLNCVQRKANPFKHHAVRPVADLAVEISVLQVGHAVGSLAEGLPQDRLPGRFALERPPHFFADIKLIGEFKDELFFLFELGRCLNRFPGFRSQKDGNLLDMF
ncbi:MAG: hypothetical protein BWY42_01334 [Candidatus Omnitrophica bacterium ADurb.Bin277]|nr:MAG: hypothetical protein BWY42_01334 [Candidatus Omnitrophica bacterium ADurb.Bin277]